MKKNLSLPSSLLDHESVMKMATLLLPAVKCADAKSGEFRPYATFAKVFTASIEEIRNQFFSDALTKHLWSRIFIVESPEICTAHLRRIRSQPTLGELKYDRLLTDMLCNEMNFNFSMLPEKAKNREDNIVFTEREAYNDLVENGAYIELDNDDGEFTISNKSN